MKCKKHGKEMVPVQKYMDSFLVCEECLIEEEMPTSGNSGLVAGYVDKTEPLIVNSIEITASDVGGELPRPVKNEWKNGKIDADGDMMFNVQLDNGIIVFVKLEILKST